MNEMIVHRQGVEDDIYLPRGAAVELRGKLFVVRNRVHVPEPGLALEEPGVPGVIHVISSREAKDLYFQGHLTFRASGFESLPEAVRENLRVALDAFSPDLQEEMARRLGYCELVDRLPPTSPKTPAAMQPLLDEYAAERNDERPHSWSSVRRWHSVLVMAGHDPRALCPNHHRKGNRNAKVPAAMDKSLKEAVDAWLDLGRPSMSYVYGKVLNSGVSRAGGRAAAMEVDRLAPSLEAFRNRCKAVDRATTLAYRYGPKVARQTMSPVGAGPDVRFPLERVELDFMYMPLFIVDDGPNPMPLGTPYIMAGIDCYSGVITGFDVGFDPPSYVSAARCLKHMILPKRLEHFPKDEYGASLIANAYPVNGVPYQMFLDNDQAFHAHSFVQSAKALGCNVHYVPPGQPWKKGRIERFWLTLQQTYFGGLPGKVFKPHERPDGYDPSKHAVLTLSEFSLLLNKAIIDHYNASFDEWRGERRIDLWTKGMQLREARPLPAHESLVELVGAHAHRVADNRGIRIHGLRYNSPTLADYRNLFEENPSVEIRYDAQDLKEIWVVDRERRISLRVPCTRPEYAEGLSEHQHKVIRASVAAKTPQGRLHIRELMIAKAELYALAESMLRTKKAKRGRMRVAQFLGIGRELLDDIARRPFDAEQSRSHMDFSDDEDLSDDEESSKGGGGAGGSDPAPASTDRPEGPKQTKRARGAPRQEPPVPQSPPDPPADDRPGRNNRPKPKVTRD